MSSTKVIGTSHFLSYGAALSFYGNVYGRATVSEVQKKIKRREIIIGEKPALQPGDTLLIDRSEGRYKIERRSK